MEADAASGRGPRPESGGASREDLPADPLGGVVEVRCPAGEGRLGRDDEGVGSGVERATSAARAMRPVASELGSLDDEADADRGEASGVGRLAGRFVAPSLEVTMLGSPEAVVVCAAAGPRGREVEGRRPSVGVLPSEAEPSPVGRIGAPDDAVPCAVLPCAVLPCAAVPDASPGWASVAAVGARRFVAADPTSGTSTPTICEADSEAAAACVLDGEAAVCALEGDAVAFEPEPSEAVCCPEACAGPAGAGRAARASDVKAGLGARAASSDGRASAGRKAPPRTLARSPAGKPVEAPFWRRRDRSAPAALCPEASWAWAPARMAAKA